MAPQLGLDFKEHLLIKELEPKFEVVDRELIRTREVLKDPSEEGLREEEAGDPEGFGFAVHDPVEEHLDLVLKIFEVVDQRLLRGIGNLCPSRRDSVRTDPLHDLYGFLRHLDLSVYDIKHILQCPAYLP